jgi:hypothetical protein
VETKRPDNTTNQTQSATSPKPILAQNTTNTTLPATNNTNTTKPDPAKLDQPNPEEPVKFNPKLFSDLYSQYPPAKNDTPPASSEA